MDSPNEKDMGKILDSIDSKLITNVGGFLIAIYLIYTFTGSIETAVSGMTQTQNQTNQILHEQAVILSKQTTIIESSNATVQKNTDVIQSLIYELRAARK